jgi:hypothetical protein
MKRSIGYLLAALSLVGVSTTSVLAQQAGEYACAIANDTYVRDYPTFKPVARLQRGECMSTLPDDYNNRAVRIVFRKGETFYVVSGISGNLRVVSTRYTRLK